MSSDDPFGLSDHSDRTIVQRPRPGGRRSAEAISRPQRRGPSFQNFAADVQTRDANPLVQAARPLLALAPSLRSPRPPGDPNGLRSRLADELRRLEDRAIAQGARSEDARLAAWTVGALLDDIVLNTPWGAQSAWSTQSLVGTLYHEVNAGERFFERLSELQRQPARYHDILELMYYCLLLGFEGRFRIRSSQGGRIQDVTEGLHRLLAKPDIERELSPRWRGADMSHKPASTIVPMWVVGAGSLLILGLIYLGFNFRLAGYADQIGPLVRALPPAGAVELVRPQPIAPVAPQPIETTVAPEPEPLPEPVPRLPNPILPEINQFLEREVAVGEVETAEDPQRVMIRVKVQGLFGSGESKIEPQYVDLISRIGDALDGRGGRIAVTGHSDNVPIRTARFPSNWELSEARALSVAQMIESRLSADRPIIVEGRADTQPIADNSTAAGRAANRRIEISLFKDRTG